MIKLVIGTIGSFGVAFALMGCSSHPASTKVVTTVLASPVIAAPPAVVAVYQPMMDIATPVPAVAYKPSTIATPVFVPVAMVKKPISLASAKPAVYVVGVAIGLHSSAQVSGWTTSEVRVGDRLQESTVAQITSRGVMLKNGRFIAVGVALTNDSTSTEMPAAATLAASTVTTSSYPVANSQGVVGTPTIGTPEEATATPPPAAPGADSGVLHQNPPSILPGAPSSVGPPAGF
jgi:hypothetical protein